MRVPRLVWRVGKARPLGAVVIDRTVAGRACGGIRAVEAIDTAALAELARAMTLKFAFLGIACGGAKACVVVPARASDAEREIRMRTFGGACAPLLRTGAYVAGTDMGTGELDLWAMRTGAELPAGPRPLASAGADSATAAYSGRTAAVAALVGLAHLGRSTVGATLAIAGYGRVGAALARRFVAAGGRLVAVSTAAGAVVEPAGIDVARLERLREAHGDFAPAHYPGTPLRPDRVLTLPVDVLAPCAGQGMLGPGVETRCRIVAPGANAAVTADGEQVLAAAGVLAIPDFVASAGGVLVSHFWPLDPPPEAATRLIERTFCGVVTALLDDAERAGETPSVRARALAEANLLRLERAGKSVLRHERVLSRLGSGRVRRLLPRGVRTRLVTLIARALVPAVAPA